MTNSILTALVVEDEKLLNWSLVKSLGKWGYDVFPVFTGMDAVEQLKKCDYDIILLDYQLPDVDGLQIARRVRQVQPTAVIFLVTAFELSELSPDPGLIDAYFNKPVDLQQLRKALNEIPARHDQVQRSN